MERDDEEATQESSCRGTRQAGRLCAQRGQTARLLRKRPQRQLGQKPQKKNGRPSQHAAGAPWPQEIVQIVIASICARFGDGVIGFGDSGIRYSAHALS